MKTKHYLILVAIVQVIFIYLYFYGSPIFHIIEFMVLPTFTVFIAVIFSILWEFGRWLFTKDEKPKKL